jgi:hypothetical protein
MQHLRYLIEYECRSTGVRGQQDTIDLPEIRMEGPSHAKKILDLDADFGIDSL